MLHIIDNYYAKTNNYGYTVTRQRKKQENRGSYMRNPWLCRNAEGSGGTGKERYSAQPHKRKGCGAFRNTGLFKGADRTDTEGHGRGRSLGGKMLQQLYSIQEIGILLLQISGFLLALLVVWIIILAGTELFRDRINSRIEENRKEMEILKEKIREEEIRGKQLDKEGAVYDMALRNLRFIDRHLKAKGNNYRKLHGLPLIRRRQK